MLIRKKYSVWHLDTSLYSKCSSKKLENAFFTGKPGFDFLYNCFDISALSNIVFCKKINSANEYLVFIR